jgi:hypothetical protein
VIRWRVILTWLWCGPALLVLVPIGFAAGLWYGLRNDELGKERLKARVRRWFRV